MPLAPYALTSTSAKPSLLTSPAVAELGYAALAITDRNSLAGVVRTHAAAKQAKLKLLIGAELSPHDAPAAVLLATDRPAYGRLSRLITVGRRNAPKGECRLSFDDIASHSAGLLAAVVGAATPDDLGSYREVFGDRCYLLAELHLGQHDERELEQRIALAKQSRVKLAAANDVHFHNPGRRPLADVLTATRHGCTVAAAGDLLFPNASRHLKSPREMQELFARCPDAIRRTVEIAERCAFSLDELRYEYPEELAPAGRTPLEHLTQLTWEGARSRYPPGIPDKVRRLLEHELQLIAELRPADVNHSRWDCTLEGDAVRLGFRMVVGMPHAQALRIEQARERGAFRSVDDFSRRSGVSRAVVARLARADAFGSLRLDRRASLWESLRPASSAPLFQGMEDEPPLALPQMEPRQEVFADYQMTGLSLKAHPVSFFREQLSALRVVPASRLRSLSGTAAMCASPASCWSASAPARPKASPSSRWKMKRASPT